MDFRNVLIAIVLSTLVLVGWATFFEPPIVEQQTTENEITKNEDLSSPSIDEGEKEIKNEITRNDVINNTNRIKVENENIKGSISLQGAIIDDIIFKNYNETLNGENKVIFLNPKNSSKEYFIETGWAAGGDEKIKLPLGDTIWKIKGNSTLTTNNPVKLTWSNSQGITFEKHISLDDQFLFTVKEKVINSSDKTYNFYSYGQIIRNKLPEISGFYILHEGFLSVLDDQLIEEDYDDIQEKKFTQTAQEGFFGYSDKFWLTSIIPPRGKEFKTTFDYKNKFRANYISSEGTEVGPNDAIEEKIQIIVAAKRVQVIDGYAENLNINKFDLAIDWGVMYFLTKPLFFVIDYFFKLLGNYGLAIIAVTVCIRLVFFPLANYSFRSMGKMKLLHPEMTRLKELLKNDKMK